METVKSPSPFAEQFGELCFKTAEAKANLSRVQTSGLSRVIDPAVKEAKAYIPKQLLSLVSRYWQQTRVKENLLWTKCLVSMEDYLIVASVSTS